MYFIICFLIASNARFSPFKIQNKNVGPKVTGKINLFSVGDQVMMSSVIRAAQREYCNATEEIISVLVMNEKVQDVSGGRTASQSFEVLCVFAGSEGKDRCNA